MSSFLPIINKKDRRANFWIKRFNVPGFFTCGRVTLNSKLIWHSLMVEFYKFKSFFWKNRAIDRFVVATHRCKPIQQGIIDLLICSHFGSWSFQWWILKILIDFFLVFKVAGVLPGTLNCWQLFFLDLFF